MSTEPKVKREIKCGEYMNHSIYIHSEEIGSDRQVLVSIEGARCSLDLGKAEALEVAAAIVWAANGGRKS